MFQIAGSAGEHLCLTIAFALCVLQPQACVATSPVVRLEAAERLVWAEDNEAEEAPHRWCGSHEAALHPKDVVVVGAVTAQKRGVHGDYIAAQTASLFWKRPVSGGKKDEYGQEEIEDSWKPIRIGAHTRDMNDPKRFCTRAGEVQRAVVAGKITVCTLQDILTVRKKRVITEVGIPQAIKLHAERLFVRPLPDRVVLPPLGNEYCGSFSVPPEHFSIGFEEDVSIYVAARPTIGSVAWASLCAVLDDGRPVASVTNISPRYVAETDFFVRVLAHEVGHALGFQADLLIHKGVMRKFSGIRGQKSSWVVDAPIARRVAEKHFNCPKAQGIEMENEGGDGVHATHLEQRNAPEDLMAPYGDLNYYTVMSLAVFASLGFYRANFSRAEPTRWGLSAGCSFLNEKCLVGGKSKHPDTFCDQPPGNRLFTCTHDRLSLGRCSIAMHRSNLPEHFRYFGHKKLGGNAHFMDHCPVVKPYIGGGCTGGQAQRMRGSAVAVGSRCVKGVGLKYSRHNVGDVCVRVNCSGKDLQIQFALDHSWQACKPGSRVRPRNRHLWNGSAICPKREEVCFEYTNRTLTLTPLPKFPDDDYVATTPPRPIGSLALVGSPRSKRRSQGNAKGYPKRSGKTGGKETQRH